MSLFAPVALQLYSVRDDAARDLPAVLKQVAAMGYIGVEFAGFHGHDAATVKHLLTENGLQVAGAHVAIETLLGDALDETVAYHMAIGNEFLIVPYLSGEYTESAEAWERTAQTMNEIAAKLHVHGMRTGYHNHTHEFQPVMGSDKLPWDIFFGATDTSVIMQFDTGNALHGGKDALPFLQAYPGRAVTVHLKEHSDTNPTALLGEGDVPFPALLAELKAQDATQWLILEQEAADVPAMAGAEKSLRNLEKIAG